jgi:hypothetical protein
MLPILDAAGAAVARMPRAVGQIQGTASVLVDIYVNPADRCVYARPYATVSLVPGQGHYLAVPPLRWLAA